MAFDDLTDKQRELDITIIEELESGGYSEDFLAKCGRSGGVEMEWVLVFTTVGGTKERVSANFGRTHLHTLRDTGYVTLIQRHPDEFTCAPKQKAYEQYELHRRPLYEKLSSHFRRDLVFMAQPSIEPGALWLDAIEDAKRSCDVMIVLIGKQWLTVTDDHGRRRLDDPEDLLRRKSRPLPAGKSW